MLQTGHSNHIFLYDKGKSEPKYRPLVAHLLKQGSKLSMEEKVSFKWL